MHEQKVPSQWVAFVIFGVLMFASGSLGMYTVLTILPHNNLQTHETTADSVYNPSPTAVPISTPTPTPEPPKTIVTGSDKTDWLKVESRYSNFSFSAPNSWKISFKNNYDSETFELLSPNNLLVTIRTGIRGLGGGPITPIPLGQVSYEQISFLNQTFYLTINPEQEYVDKKPVRIAYLKKDPQGTGWLEIKNLGTYGGYPDFFAHSGTTEIRLVYLDKDESMTTKSVEEFKSADYEIVKEILSSAKFLKN